MAPPRPATPSSSRAARALRLLGLAAAARGGGALRVSMDGLREYELKHARVAMCAVPALAALGAAGVAEPVRWLAAQPADVQLVAFSAAAVLEAGATLPRFRAGLELRDDLEPGRFPPLPPPPSPAVAHAELAVGRAAMLAAAAWVAAGAAAPPAA